MLPGQESHRTVVPQHFPLPLYRCSYSKAPHHPYRQSPLSAGHFGCPRAPQSRLLDRVAYMPMVHNPLVYPILVPEVEASSLREAA
jgi:hypothetical protein